MAPAEPIFHARMTPIPAQPPARTIVDQAADRLRHLGERGREHAALRAERALDYPDDIERVRARHAAYWSGPGATAHRFPDTP
jgi:hypothetical protein